MDYEKDFEEGFENTSLGSIYYKHHGGSGKKMIFLHGLGGTSRVWTRLMEYMPSDLDILLLDLLGSGRSDKPRIDYTISTQFQALREFISLRNSGDSCLYGQSYGAFLAAYYATQPYTCKGIILQDAAGIKEFSDEWSATNDFISEKETLIKRATQHDASNEEYVIRSMVESEFSEEALTKESLSAVKVPALVLWGEKDDVIDKRFGYLLNAWIKNSQLKIIEEAGHNAHYTHPKEISKLILDFIEYKST